MSSRRNPGKLTNRVVLAAVVILILLAASIGGLYAYRQLNPAPSCAVPLGGAQVHRTQLTPSTLGGVTDYSLPSPDREPIAPTVAPDGSLWFVEQSVVSFAHLYPGNGTLVEYAWPYNYKAPPSSDGICGDKTLTWGVALWDGKVWASDTTGNQLVALDPSTGKFSTIKLPTASSFPYTLTPGPNDTLWFTELFSGKVGEITSSGALHEYAVPGGSMPEPAQVVFANSTTGYFANIGDSVPQGGGVYSFKVDDFNPVLVGGQGLTDPTSLSLGDGAVWVALHGTSHIADYNFTTKSWTYYPSTPIAWASVTLPYFVNATGSSVWFNEHYGNRMAQLDLSNRTLTEYSESAGQVNGSNLPNTLTFGQGGGRAWFAEMTGDTVGYASSSYDPGFYTSIAGNSTVVLPRGSSALVTLEVHQTIYNVTLKVSYADSEGFSSVPENLTFTTANAIPAPYGGSTFDVKITALSTLAPGTYTAILTATDGVTFESSLLEIVVPS